MRGEEVERLVRAVRILVEIGEIVVMVKFSSF